MPETPLAGRPGEEVERTLEQVVADHPGLVGNQGAQGGRLNDYHPQPLPDDPTAQQYYQMYQPADSGQPAPTQQGQPEQAQPQPGQPAPAPRGGLIFGKYKSIEEAERGYREADSRRQAVERENTALKAVNLHLEQIFAPMRQKREEPTPPQYTPVQFQGDQPVVATDSFVAQAEERARAAAREEVRNVLEPLQRMNATQSRMAAEFPDFPQRQHEFSSWLSANPTYQERMQADPDGGLELAYLRFEREVGAVRQNLQQQATQQARGQVEQARSAASATSSAPGAGVRRSTEQDGQTAQVRDALKFALETGDWGPYKKARLEEALGPQYMNTLNQTTWGR